VLLDFHYVQTWFFNNSGSRQKKKLGIIAGEIATFVLMRLHITALMTSKWKAKLNS
jgi:hypothetical protein